MSQHELWTALGRSRIDPDFNHKLMMDAHRALEEAGFQLSPEEKETMRQAFIPYGAPPPGTPPPAPEDVEHQRAKMRERLDAQIERANDLGRYTASILKDTLNNARSAYHRITLMNTAMFAAGIGLFLAAAIYGAVSKDTSYTFVLAGLGAANFVALFMLGPVERTQTALSNLVQVEVMFMNYFEQITFWDAYVFSPRPVPPDLQIFREASEQLQKRTQDTVAQLQRYIEDKPSARTSVSTEVREPAS